MKMDLFDKAKMFNNRGIDRFYLQDWNGGLHRQRLLETSSAVNATMAVEDLEKAGYKVVVCEYPMSGFSSLKHIVVYASNTGSKSFAQSVARLITVGSGRIKNAMFLGNGKVSDKPIGGVDEITLVTAV